MTAESHILTGRAFAPGASAAISADAYLRQHQVFLANPDTGQVLTRCERADLRLGEPVGSGPRNVHFPDGWLFQTTDPAVTRLLNESLFSQALRRLEVFHPRLMLVALGAALAAVAVWNWFVPAMVWVVVWMTPDPLVRQIDRGTLSSLDYLIAEPTTLSAEVQADNQRLLADLLPQAQGLGRREVTLQFRAMPGFGPNAFALPGGTLVLTDELVQRYGEDRELIAGVLAHELGHVAEDHSLRQLYQSLSLYVLIAMIAGDVGPILEDLALEGQTLASLSFSRKHELAADRYALLLLQDSGYSSAGLQRFFREMAVHDHGSRWISTHPHSADRLQNIKEFSSDAEQMDTDDLPHTGLPGVNIALPRLPR